MLIAASAAHATPVPQKLGGALQELAARQFTAANPQSALAQQRRAAAAISGEQMTASDTDSVMRDELGRVLVNILVDGSASHDRVRALVDAIPGVKISAEDKGYRAGIIEGFVPEAALIPLAKLRGISAIHPVVRPVTNVGAVTQQGLVQHRVDQISQDGTGITVGVLSDSYNTARYIVGTTTTLTVREAQDIASGDLPGPGNPAGNTTPVTVLKDYGTYPNTSATDEGRAMAQLVHDMAPKARLGFATAFDGDVAFANNIRALAGVQGLPNSRPDFAAQVIVDDVQYFNEGMFADTIIAQAVDDVTAMGVSYFSSAGNTPPTQGYASDLRIVPVGPNATAGTNINLTGVPANLYAGGFHNFRSDGTQDIAQTVTLSNRQLRFVLQWDDPYDVTPTTLGPVVLQQPGALTNAAPTFNTTFNNPVAGKQYQVDVQGVSDFGGDLDVIVAIIQPDGTTLQTIDTGAGETFSFFAPQAGTYTIRVTGFNNDRGTFTVTVNEGSGVSKMTSDFNVLFFRPDNGAYLGAVAENNLASNRPVELPGTLTFPTGLTQVQMVIARANTPSAPQPASRLRYKVLNAAFPAEYVSYNTPITYGHNSAAGANGVAAYSPFQPNIPEDFTSTGPVRIVWDRNNNRIPDAQQVRLKPNLAAMDGGNTTFFSSDTGRDLDALPNFFGTSAAAPNAAAIAALVLQAKGGPGSVTPAQMRTMLQNSAFPHDLDPYRATAAAVALPNRGKVSIAMDGDNSVQSVSDANGTTIAYTGTSSITSITFNAQNGNPGGGNVSNPSTPGLVYDTRSVAAGGQPFIVGSGSVTAADATATFSNPAPAPSVAGMYYTVKIDFTPGVFTGGKTFKFGLDRDEYRSAFLPPNGDSRNGSSADLAGSGVRIPAGTIATGGITFTGTLADGSTFSGVMTNRIGAGYSFLDGFGFINAQSAVNQPLP
ncbi:S8 family serine peptidase [Aquabacterium sp.]|uniref:S8 family serine peptidase n=1 Tax=Aquabacterium sp. TaxID=1872578 RepID=UPI00378517C5